jgi:hypothetical protein
MAVTMVFVVAFTAHRGIKLFHLGARNREMRVVKPWRLERWRIGFRDVCCHMLRDEEKYTPRLQGTRLVHMGTIPIPRIIKRTFVCHIRSSFIAFNEQTLSERPSFT